MSSLTGKHVPAPAFDLSKEIESDPSSSPIDLNEEVSRRHVEADCRAKKAKRGLAYEVSINSDSTPHDFMSIREDLLH